MCIIEPARIQLTELVSQLLDLASQADRRHSFSWSAPMDLEVFADLDRLQQIISNLLTNALKYSASGALELGGRLDADRSSREEGSGLGLWIARELARGMGGDLWLTSRLGENTTFFLALPT